MPSTLLSKLPQPTGAHDSHNGSGNAFTYLGNRPVRLRVKVNDGYVGYAGINFWLSGAGELSGTSSCRANAVVCKAVKAGSHTHKAAAAALVATTLLAGVSATTALCNMLHVRTVGKLAIRGIVHNFVGCKCVCFAFCNHVARILIILQEMNAVLSCLLSAQSAQAISYDDLQGLTYLQVKGSGIANTCPVIEGGSTNLRDLKPGSYK